MRLFGHPVHVMLIHFPVALWPAHTGLHVFNSLLPAGVAAVAGFWVLTVGTALGWFAAFFGACDLLEIWKAGDRQSLKTGLTHGAINGSVLLGFTVLFGLEYFRYPEISHGMGFLAIEGALLALLGIGNYFGGNLVWTKTPVT